MLQRDLNKELIGACRRGLFILYILSSCNLWDIQKKITNKPLGSQIQKLGEWTEVITEIWDSLMLEKAVAPNSSTLAWKIPWTEETGGLQSMGSLRVGHD